MAEGLTNWNTAATQRSGGWTLPGTTPIQNRYDDAGVTCAQRDHLVNQSADLSARIQMWTTILKSLTGPGDWIARQLINMELDNLRRRKASTDDSLRLAQITAGLDEIENERLAEVAAFGEPGMAYTEGAWQMPSGEFAATGPWTPVGGKDAAQVYAERVSREAQLLAEQEAIKSQDYSSGIGGGGGIAVPAWMQEYLDRNRPAGAGMSAGAVAQRAGKTTGYGEGGQYQTNQAALRPLGAQADLDQEQLQMLAAYLGWVKAGAPMNANQYLSSMGNAADWWEEYTQRSMALHPASVYLGKATRRIR